NMIASGEIESVRIGRSRRIPAEAIDRYVEGLRAKGG
ncbi:MAG: excisionase family DNA-binding protein, partial [Dehalococcoidia bacterium]|nr:excisionase family DNA-binding protein [Dehalococcoidia bacterium]